MSPEHPEKRRFTLNLPAPAIEELERVRAQGGHGALAEVVREAVAVYLSLHEGRRKGLELYFRDEENDQSGPIWLLPGAPPGTKGV